jgi:glucokinase
MAATRTLHGGIDLGGTKIQAVVVDDRNEILGQARRATPTVGGPPDIVAELAGTLEEAATAAGVATADLVAVGVGAPGAADTETGVLAHPPNLPGWEEPYPVAGELGARVGAPVVLGNDVGVAVDAEFVLGAAQAYRSMVGIWWGTGVGGGIILDGEHWRGRGAAGELGHMIVKEGGRKEPRGLQGTIEAYAGRAAMEARARKLVEKGAKTSLFRIMEKKGRTRLASGVWAKALAQGDPMAIQLVDEAIDVLGAGAASVVNLLDVEAVVIGGGLGTRLGQPYADRISKAMARHLFRPEVPPAVLAAALGDLGGAIGGALLARQMAPARTTEPATMA